MYLHLDGIRQFGDVFEILTDVEEPSWGRRVYIRLVAPIQSVLAIVTLLGLQLPRGVCCVVIGIFTTEEQKFIFGLIDLLSSVFQVLMLPIIGIVTCIDPSTGLKLYHEISCYDVRYPFERTTQYQEDPSFSKIQKFITEFFRSLFAIPIVLVAYPGIVLSNVLNGHVTKARENVLKSLSFLAIMPFFLCCICGSSFDPSLMHNITITKQLSPRKQEFKELKPHTPMGMDSPRRGSPRQDSPRSAQTNRSSPRNPHPQQSSEYKDIAHLPHTQNPSALLHL